jgi:hypothetical protein
MKRILTILLAAVSLANAGPIIKNGKFTGAPDFSAATNKSTIRSDLGTNSASNLNTGTVANGLLPAALTGHTYNGLTVTSSTGTLTIGTGTFSTAGVSSGTFSISGGSGTNLSVYPGENLSFNGGFSYSPSSVGTDTILRATGATDVTLPTTGTLATLANHLGQFASTTSAQLASVLTDDVGAGAFVRNDSPAFIGGGTSAASLSVGPDLFSVSADSVSITNSAGVMEINTGTTLEMGALIGGFITLTGTQLKLGDHGGVNNSTQIVLDDTAETIVIRADNGITVTGTIAASGSGLTALNASNLGSGTVPTARLAGGTASSATFLRGDQTWASPTTSLSGKTTTTQSLTTTTLTDLTSLSLSLASGTNYAVEGVIFYQTSSGTEGLGLSVANSGGAVASAAFGIEIFSSTAGAMRSEVFTTLATKVQHTTGVGATTFQAYIRGVINVTTATTLKVQGCTETGGGNTATIQANSVITATPL